MHCDLTSLCFVISQCVLTRVPLDEPLLCEADYGCRRLGANGLEVSNENEASGS